MNDNDLERVFSDIDFTYKEYTELKLVYMLKGNYLWLKNESGILKGYKNFSLRNLDKLLKMLKKKHIEFTKFEIKC